MNNNKLLIINSSAKLSNKTHDFMGDQYDFFEKQLDLIYDWTRKINSGEEVKTSMNLLLKNINNMENEIISLLEDINLRVRREIEIDRRMENVE